MSKVIDSNLEKKDGIVPVDSFTGGSFELLSSKKVNWRTKLRGIIWDSLDKSPEERKFIFKMDCWVMSYICVAHFVKYLDSMNVSNAYVSGMKEELHFGGLQYNYLSTWYFIGYILGHVPSQVAISYIRPSIWLPANELIYGAVVMGMAGAKNVKTMYALRFLVGLFESSSYGGIMTILSNFYLPDELGKRTCIFQTTSSAAQMFSGYLQTGLHKGMNGVGGLAAFRWLFIFDGIITIPVAIVGFFAIPDEPLSSRAFWFNEKDREIAIGRLKRGNRNTKPNMKFQDFLDICVDWPVYLFTLWLSCHVLATKLYGYMNLWLKSAGSFSISQINDLPTAGYGLQIFATLCWAWLSDAIGNRWSIITLACIPAIIGSIILWVWPSNQSALFAGWYLMFAETGAAALFNTWMLETLGTVAEQRYLMIGIVETISFIFKAAVPIYLFPADKAPHYPYAYPITFMFFTLEAVVTLVIALIQRLERKGVLRNKHLFVNKIQEILIDVEQLEKH